MKQNIFTPGKTKILYGGVEFTDGDRTAINRILDQNWWGIGKETEKFEKELAKYNKVKRAIFVNSGSSALLLAFAALQLPPSSEVLVPAVTFPTPISGLLYLNLVPVVVDVDETLNINPKQIEKALSSKTRAILVVHTAGNPANMESIMVLAKKHKLFVIEDNCDGFGGRFKSKMLGSFGHLATISTHAAHMISTGEGGVVFTKDAKLADKVNALRNWGRLNHLTGRNNSAYKSLPKDYSRRYIYNELGFNLKPIELQAALGRSQLKRIEEFKRKRLTNYTRLYRIFQKYQDYFDLPICLKASDPCWYTFAFLTKNHNREKFTDFLDSKNIEWRNILAGNIARQPAFISRVKTPVPLTFADEILRRGLWISVHPLMTQEMFGYIENCLNEYFKKIKTKKSG